MDFAFLIHSRDYTDIARKFKIAKYLPKSWVEFWCLHWPPFIVSKIDGLKDEDEKDCKGWLIGVPLTAKQMIENRELAKKRIVQAIKKL
jgi:predicted amino acid dehydrogenase